MTTLPATPGAVASLHPALGLGERLHRVGPPARTAGITVLLALSWPLCLLLPAPAVVPGTPRPTWLALGLLFAAAELDPIRFRLGRRNLPLRLGAVPLTLGLFALAPAWLLIGRVGGYLLAAAVTRRHWRALPLDVAVRGAAVVLAAAAFHPLAGAAGADSVRGWLAALLAAGAAAAVTGCGFLVAGYAPLPELFRVDRPRLACRRLLREAPAVAPAVLIALGLCLAPARAFTLAELAAAGALGAGLRPGHPFRAAGTERLLQLSLALRDATGVESVARAAVAHSPQLLSTGYVEVVLARRGARAGRSWRAWADGSQASGSVDLAEVENLVGLSRRMISRGQDPAADRLLTGRRLADAVVVPLSIGDGLLAALLVGQPADARTRPYRPQDLHRIGTIGNQVTVALRHAHAVERLHHDALHDALTGLPNRTEFRARAVEAVAGAAGGLVPCAIGVLDLDGFKTVNDSLGHLAGDQVLAEVGRRMSRLAGSGLLVSRLGGDEFAVLVQGIPDESEVVELARRLLEGVHAPFVVDGEQVRLTGSLGLACAPRDGMTADQLLRNADVAMYAAKAEAGGLRVYTRELSDSVDAPLSLAADLRLALARGDLTIAVQPLVNLTSGRLHSVEALARWRHPAFGLVNPETFVLAAERGGLVGELTESVIDQALSACRVWLDSGLEVQVAVNLAARLLSDPGLPASIESALRRYDLPGRLLCLELTETGVITSPDRALAVLGRLRELGVCLAVDDFGTGYSSMTYMNWLSPDQVKIDKSFVQRLRFDPRNEAIVRSIIDLGRNLGVEVVAEGVGDARTATVLSDYGCTLGQGFLFAEPMAPQDLPDWFTGWMAVPERGELDADEAQFEAPLDRGGDLVPTAEPGLRPT